jgi:hypothetical protein
VKQGVNQIYHAGNQIYFLCETQRGDEHNGKETVLNVAQEQVSGMVRGEKDVAQSTDSASKRVQQK